mmetsp:Transcript_25053/g.70146  ORF Transcript_25053/g.70146 Transcript_25053/m.70146 type:complete len:222 (-) Transcript_25053:1272-1937(-)
MPVDVSTLLTFSTNCTVSPGSTSSTPPAVAYSRVTSRCATALTDSSVGTSVRPSPAVVANCSRPAPSTRAWFVIVDDRRFSVTTALNTSVPWLWPGTAPTVVEKVRVALVAASPVSTSRTYSAHSPLTFTDFGRSWRESSRQSTTFTSNTAWEPSLITSSVYVSTSPASATGSSPSAHTNGVPSMKTLFTADTKGAASAGVVVASWRTIVRGSSDTPSPPR